MENALEENSFRRPTFLVMLCIFTFVGSGWNILADLFYLFTANIIDGTIDIEQNSAMVGELESQGIDSFFSGFWNSSLGLMQAGMQHAREIVVFQLILNVIVLVGAILMFQLRRPGFYLYVAAQILLLFIWPYFTGFHLVVIIKMLLAGLVSFLFIAFYAFHLKYMNR